MTMSSVETICLVDDDDVYQYIMERTIIKKGLAQSILKFMDGEEAISFIQEHLENEAALPDVIFLDLNMPVMDGWDFLAEFDKLKSSIQKKISIFIVTSSVNDPDIQKAKTFPEVSGYIIKPITEETLFEVMEKVEC